MPCTYPTSGRAIVNAWRITLSWSPNGLPSTYNPILLKVRCMSRSTYATLFSLPKVEPAAPYLILSNIYVAFPMLISKYSSVIPRAFPVVRNQTVPLILGGRPSRHSSIVFLEFLVRSQYGRIFFSHMV